MWLIRQTVCLAISSLIGSHKTTTDENSTERYFELLKNAKVKGYLFAQQNYNDVPASKPAA